MQIFTRHFRVFDHVLIYNVNDKKKRPEHNFR